MHEFKSAILPGLKNCQNGTFEPMHRDIHIECSKKKDVCVPIWERHGGKQCEQYYGRIGNHGDSESSRLALYVSFGWIVTFSM